MCDECNEVHNTLQSTMKHDTVRISQLRKRTLQEVAMTPLCAEHDDEPCWITGIANLSSNLWVIADKSNSKLKIYTDEFKLKSEYFIEQAPFDVTAIDQSQIGVSIPAEYKIQIYDVKTGIDPVKSVKIKAQCYGISFSNNMFVVACPLSAPPSVRFVSLDGQEMTQMSPRDNVIPLFLRPLYVKYYPNGVDFAVSDANKNHVSCLNRAVFRHFKYVNFNLTGPRGITLTQNGELYACGWGSDNVHKIDGNGKYVEEILNRHNGIISPQNICVSANQKLLLVTLDLTSGNSDTISVFEL
ncbi:hypothetical protein FSP39_016582 [Pinctada imbricata]|uniref:Uncharacterized protein n=1 Tax=Pinctada imbricata TaxID=66713 RepID=A0AA88YVJ6_PINIB|nr:hypothetical protein FSP39_016582 [Pinctada imbricata]